MARKLTPAKAGTILRHGEVRGTPLSKKQKGFFGAIRGGQPLRQAAKAAVKGLR